MIKNSEPNIAFSENDLIRLQKVQDRLDNYIKEIDIHAKKLTYIEGECEKKDKERTYLNEQSKELSKNIEDSKKIAIVLEEEIKTKKKTLEELEKSSKEIHDRLFHHDDTLKQRESKLVSQELEHEKKVESLSKSIKEHGEKKALVENAHKKLKETIDALQW